MLQPLPDPNQLLVGALAFLRIGGIVFALPVTGDPPTPLRTRIMLSIAITIGMYSAIPASYAPVMANEALVVVSLVLRELLIGVVIGYLGRMAFDGMVMAASVVASQMGFGTSNLFLPDSTQAMDSFTAFHRLVLMLLFFTLQLHHVFFSAIADTFRLIPCGGATLHNALGPMFIQITGGIFAVALQLAAPLLVALLFSMAALGLVSRVVPQMNVFTTSFPVSFALGLVVYVATFPFFPAWMQGHFLNNQDYLAAAIRGMKP